MTSALRLVEDGPCPHCRGFRERVEELEEELRQARAMDAAVVTFTPPAEWRLTPGETRIMELLCQRSRVSRDSLVQVWETEHPDWTASSKIFDVWVSKIRAKTSGFGVTIETIRGSGYALAGSCRAQVIEACRPDGGGVSGRWRAGRTTWRRPEHPHARHRFHARRWAPFDNPRDRGGVRSGAPGVCPQFAIEPGQDRPAAPPEGRFPGAGPRRSAVRPLFVAGCVR